MKKTTKIWIITATILVLAGIIISTAAMAATGWNFKNLSNSKYETNSHEINEEFQNIAIETSTAEIVFKPSDSKSTEVLCFEDIKTKHSVAVENGTLVIEETDSRQWFDFIGLFHFDFPKITVYLPQNSYASLFIETDTGDVEIPADFSFGNITATGDTGDIQCFASAMKLLKLESDTGSVHAESLSAEEVDLSVDTGSMMAKDITCSGNMNIKAHTGDTNLTDITCKALTAHSSTGDITLNNVIAAETFFLENDTGDIEFSDCDAAEIFAETNTGEIFGTLLSEKIFFTNSSTGDIRVPQSMSGGKCELSTNTGDIRIELK